LVLRGAVNIAMVDERLGPLDEEAEIERIGVEVARRVTCIT
jgi:hypothetical protein